MARANRIIINFMIFILIFVKNVMYFNSKHDLSIWLRIGSNPADMCLFQSHTGQCINVVIIMIVISYLVIEYILLSYPQCSTMDE